MPSIPTVDYFQVPFSRANLGSRFGLVDQWHPNPHRGVDFKEATGTPIRSAANGLVVGVYPLADSKVLGNVTVIATALRKPKVKVKGAPQVVYLGYCHQDRIVVKEGAKVLRGQVIGYVGETGSAAVGAHLHLTASWEPNGVFYGNVFDALAFIDGHDSLPGALRLGPR